MTISKRIFLMVGVLIACVSCDQITKSVAQTNLSQTEVLSFLGDTFRLQLAHNTGAFLSLGSALPVEWQAGLFSVGVGIMLLALLVYILLAKSIAAWELMALTLLLAGGVGNLIDRVLFGFVVDFINLGIGSLRTGVFNVADIAVSLSALMLMFDALPKRLSGDK